MSHPNLFTPNDRIGSAVVSGNRPASSRPFAKLALAAAFVFSAAMIAPNQADASGWYSSKNSSARVYDNQAALQSQDVRTGEVVGIRPVTLRQNDSTNGGTFIGGLIGAALGSQVANHSHGAARTLSAALGGVAGGYAGTRISNSMSHHEAIQVFVRDDTTHRVLSVVQDNDQQGLTVGTEVQLVRGSNGLAVVPLTLSDERMGHSYGSRDGGDRQSDDQSYRSRNSRYDDSEGNVQPGTTRYLGTEDEVARQNSDAAVQNIIRTRYRRP